MQTLLHVNAVDKLLTRQNAEEIETILQLIQDPEGYYNYIRRYPTAIILASAPGQRGARFDSPKARALNTLKIDLLQSWSQGRRRQWMPSQY